MATAIQKTTVAVVAIAVIALPLMGAYGAGVALERYWLNPECTSLCAVQGASLVRATPGHKSGKPPAGCMCSNGQTVAWSGPETAGSVQMATFLGLAIGVLGLVRVALPAERKRERRGKRSPAG